MAKTAAERSKKYRSRTKRRHEQAVIDAYVDGYDKGYVAGLSMAGMRGSVPTEPDFTPDD